MKPGAIITGIPTAIGVCMIIGSCILQVKVPPKRDTYTTYHFFSDNPTAGWDPYWFLQGHQYNLRDLYGRNI